MKELHGRDVLVVGLGVSGHAAARALLRLGARVRVTEIADTLEMRERAAELESQGAEVELGAHSFARGDVPLAVVSPGIPPQSEALTALAEQGAEIWGEVELAYRLGDCSFLAVTGTNGKTTTTSLLAQMLTEGGERAVAGGNIGVPLVDAVFEVGRGGVVALEVSSFQLMTIHEFRAEVAVLLNVAADHLDYHGDLESYAAAKARIVENQRSSDVFVTNLDDPIAMKIAAQAPGRVVTFSASDPGADLTVTGESLTWRGDPFAPLSSLTLEGRGGIEDALAAAGAALEHGVAPAAVARAVESFRPLAHRLQTVARIDGVDYVDDSKATNPHAALAALRGRRDVVLIAGGRSKGNDLAELRGGVPPVIAVVALGEAAEELRDVFDGVVPVEVVADMGAAVRAARAHAIPGGSVLLAPACASLDMYTSYAARGDDFARCVREILEVEAANGDA
ncbi:MAG TPA: UDP-N-acetylmuramoyl-L-alanine--D-glutamate ligase [Actinomycetota bacterium]|nr:UDP-N-acetylmuramoyl-L-alanine--D-glutamate ligase [Actinomycetota bacterium]